MNYIFILFIATCRHTIQNPQHFVNIKTEVVIQRKPKCVAERNHSTVYYANISLKAFAVVKPYTKGFRNKVGIQKRVEKHNTVSWEKKYADLKTVNHAKTLTKRI
jgi:hypothetical protein